MVQCERPPRRPQTSVRRKQDLCWIENAGVSCDVGFTNDQGRSLIAYPKPTGTGVVIMPSLPELTIIDILNQIVDRIKHARPATTSGKPTEGSIVYSQLLLGMPIDMEDY